MADETENEYIPQIALGIAAHPDDLDFGMSGTMALWASRGTRVYYLILTNGNKGCTDDAIDPKELTLIRRREQRAAAKILGVKDVFFYDYEDGMLQVTPELKCDIVRVIRNIKPDVVLTIDPSLLYYAKRGFINHPDHRAAGQATLDAVYPLARDCLSFPELVHQEELPPHKVKTVLLLNFATQNYHVDISDFIDQKMAALGAHASQMPSMSATQAMMREMAAEAGAQIGVKYAESFIRIDIQDS